MPAPRRASLRLPHLNCPQQADARADGVGSSAMLCPRQRPRGAGWQPALRRAADASGGARAIRQVPALTCLSPEATFCHDSRVLSSSHASGHVRACALGAPEGPGERPRLLRRTGSPAPARQVASLSEEADALLKRRAAKVRTHWTAPAAVAPSMRRTMPVAARASCPRSSGATGTVHEGQSPHVYTSACRSMSF